MAVVVKWHGAELLRYGRKAAAAAIKAAGYEHLKIARQMASVPNTGVKIVTQYGQFSKAERIVSRELKRIKHAGSLEKETLTYSTLMGKATKGRYHERYTREMGEYGKRLTERRKAVSARKRSLKKQQTKTRRNLKKRDKGRGFLA